MTYGNVTVYSGGDSPFAIPTVVYPPRIDVSSNDSRAVQTVDVEISNLIISPSLNITGLEVMGQDAGLFTVITPATQGSPFQIAAGANGTVKLSFHPSGFVGDVMAVLKITSNDPGPPRIIPISGVIRDPWIGSVERVAVLLPGIDSPTEFDVTLNNLGASELLVDGAFLSGPDLFHFSVVTDFSVPLVISGGSSAIVRFSVDPEGEDREFVAVLEIDSNDPIEPTRFIPVTAAGPAADFSSWALGFGIPDDPTNDSDQDGIPALMEYGLGYDPTAPDTLPTAVADGPNFTITWPKGAQASTDPQIRYVVEVSEDLTKWDPPTASNLAENTTELILTLPGGEARSFARISVVRNP
jgi:hypothetical protein